MISSVRSAGKQRSTISHTLPKQSGRKNEIDNHADTICAGPNWKLLELSGEYCSVSPFSADYQPKTNVPIAKCATTYTCPSSGDSIVLVADQVLWFGNKLHCSLINPHQIRSHGFSVCDDPWDPNWALGIDLECIYTSPRLRTQPLLRIEGPNRLGDGISSHSRNHGSSLEPSGSSNVKTVFNFGTRRQLYIDRSAGYMVGISDAPLCDLTII